MPELPEVETVRRALEKRLEGGRIRAVAQNRADLRFPLPADLPGRLAGRVVQRFRRRAKYLLLDLDDGQTLLLHLGMSGRLVLDGEGGHKHEHVTFAFADGAVLRFIDPRRFGMIDLAGTEGLEDHPRLATLGLEPMGNAFNGRALKDALGTSISPLKVALMDQRRVVGVGNIYASESLFRARLNPDRPAGTLDPGEAETLAASIRAVLTDAIAAGGSSLRDYVQTDGELGYFQHDFRVYGREGAPCLVCATPIAKRVQANRATFLCPACQA
ncbi:bifunctional DNA-formamidopyrimidine glycosylase/DNA-(apurinic or apyrimidinic site) lyase [Marinivivus vitaminiproducens]|uniref:bifunctional DNA-formamidopyrimidine glycosylase/DNA-(apurinic or apyrimidinic site) lyase n=1 Tax=Marinivivus vitaminiproducens TaxID=3035935 RepID=UPI00279C2554|nr:bifunctional DNA-formamidopyrimidine glycosylase/DNA-(apurinic or apyrimidinic site) lyase [Geminicoccaceae bacterium SCSIO 64248]